MERKRKCDGCKTRMSEYLWIWNSGKKFYICKNFHDQLNNVHQNQCDQLPHDHIYICQKCGKRK